MTALFDRPQYHARAFGKATAGTIRGMIPRVLCELMYPSPSQEAGKDGKTVDCRGFFKPNGGARLKRNLATSRY